MTRLPGAIAGARTVGERFVHSQRQQNPEGRMPFTDHLRELRNCTVKMALALAAGMARPQRTARLSRRASARVRPNATRADKF